MYYKAGYLDYFFFEVVGKPYAKETRLYGLGTSSVRKPPFMVVTDRLLSSCFYFYFLEVVRLDNPFSLKLRELIAEIN